MLIKRAWLKIGVSIVTAVALLFCGFFAGVLFNSHRLTSTSKVASSINSQAAIVTGVSSTTVSTDTASDNNLPIQDSVSVYSNGLPIKSRYILENKTLYLPIKNIGAAIGCNYVYNDKTQILTISSNGTKIIMSSEGYRAKVNDSYISCPPLTILENEVYAPADIICQHLGCMIGTNGYGYDYDNPIGADVPVQSINIYSPNYIKADKVAAKISSKIECEILQNRVYYHLAVPQIEGLKSKVFQNKINSIFLASLNDAKKAVISGAGTGNDLNSGCTFGQSFNVYKNTNDFLSITIINDFYSGGAHGNQWKEFYNFDLTSNKLIVLNDLFKPSSKYKTRLMSEIKKVWNNGTGEYNGVTLPKQDDLGDIFYIENENIIFSFAPYGLACYAAGFIEFKIPLKSISDILNDHYKKILIN